MLLRLSWALAGAATSFAAPSFCALDPPPVSPGGCISVKKPAGETSIDGDEGRSIPLATLRNIHTGDVVVLDPESPSPERFAEILEDRVTGSRVAMDPRLLGLLRRIAADRDGPGIELVSGYRSPKLNEMLRKKEHHVASHSQHSLGHAIDFRVEGMTPKEMRKLVESLGWKGGIGQYDSPTDRFVHCDVGPDRRWRER